MKLDLFIPGLTRRLLHWEKYYTEQFRYPSLEWLLARSSLSRSQKQTLDSFLFNLFVEDSSVDTINNAPVAALRNPGSPALCADPVHLKADTSDLYLNPGDYIRLDEVERQEMVVLMNSHLSEVGWEFSFTAAGGGVIKLNKELKVCTTPQSAVSGKGITQFLPEGEDARELYQLMNEMQMILHHAEFNKVRVANGQLPVNAVWIWGEGSLPQLQNQVYAKVTGSGEIERALCDLTNIVFVDHLTNTGDTPNIKDLLCMNNSQHEAQLLILRNLNLSIQADDYYSWSEIMKILDNSIFTALKQQLQQGKVSKLRILTEDGYSFNFKKIGRLNFWQRPRPLSSYLT